MSRILHFMNLSRRYRGSKGVRERRVEHEALGNLAPPGDIEENASHHYSISFHRAPSGIQNLSQRHQKFTENQKFAYGHLGNLAPLVPPKYFSYGFSGWSRCNPLKQTDNILYHKRREPKRIHASRDIQGKPSQKYI